MSTLIKKYSNRRLYNTETSSYITLEDLYQMVKNNVEFHVTDAKSGEDLTKMTLTQIIFEQENKGYNLLPINFLRNLIAFYDDNMSKVIPFYLENIMDNFVNNQDSYRQFYQNYVKNIYNFDLQEITKKNLALFQETMKMFSKKDE